MVQINNEMRFDREKRDALRKAYEKAIAEGKESFIFEGHEMLVAFVKYVLEYLDSNLGKE